MGKPVQPALRIIDGYGEINRAKLNAPPSMRKILEASERFAPKYDGWMEGHHRIAKKMLRKYLDTGYVGRGIAELGCGTATLTGGLILAMQQDVHKELAENGELGRPLTFICLDFSEQMLELAKRNITQHLNTLIQVADDQPIPLPQAAFRVEGEGSQNFRQLRYNGIPVIDVLFECKDASQLSEVRDGDKIDTVVLSYVMHWLAGWEGKRETVRKLHEFLPRNGKAGVISLEENPLVIHAELHLDEPDVQEMARLIEEATTVISVEEMRTLFMDAGFAPQDQMALHQSIDIYHTMYGQVYVNGPLEPKPVTTD
jgi:SAM-dependent methyltransferase